MCVARAWVRRTRSNRLLGRAVDEFVRTAPLSEQHSERERLSARRDDLRQRLEISRTRAEERVRVAETKLAPSVEYNRKRWWDIPPDYHPEMAGVWERVKDRTMVGHEKLNYVCDAARYGARNRIEGDVAECGVWRGGAMMACALTLDSEGDHRPATTCSTPSPG